MTHERQAAARAPILVWLLIAAAVAQLVLWGVTNATRLFGPFLILRVEDFIAIVTGVAPFLLAAAVLLAAPHWAGGRRWLLAGAAAFALGGCVALATNAWWAWRMLDPVAPEGLAQVGLVTATLVELLAAAVAPLLLAIGLIRARPRPPRHTPWWWAVTAVGVTALAGALGLLVREVSMAPASSDEPIPLIAAAVAYRLLVTLAGLSLVALALAALRALPAVRPQPEGLIAMGASTAVIGLSVSWIGQALLSFEEQGEQAAVVFTIPGVIVAVGWILIIAGFGAAALLVGTPEPSIAADGSRHVEPARG